MDTKAAIPNPAKVTPFSQIRQEEIAAGRSMVEAYDTPAVRGVATSQMNLTQSPNGLCDCARNQRDGVRKMSEIQLAEMLQERVLPNYAATGSNQEVMTKAVTYNPNISQIHRSVIDQQNRTRSYAKQFKADSDGFLQNNMGSLANV